jgi:uncharacterized protein (TIGR02284 family)
MSAMHDTSKLDDLIVTTIDSIKGYEHSAEKAKDTRYAQFFLDMANDRKQVVALLSEESRRIGGTPNTFGSAAATIHRIFESLRAALGGGDAAILTEIERGEDYLAEEFRRVLEDSRMSPDTQAVVRRAYESVKLGHDRTRALRDELAAAPN